MFPNPDCLSSIYDCGLVEDDANSARSGKDLVSTILEQTVCKVDEAVGDNCIRQCYDR